MTEIGWTEASPSDAQSASTVDDDIRSMLTNMSGGVGESMYWPGPTATQGSSAASSGELKPGSLRFARAGVSARTGGHPNGFLLLDTNRVSIHHIGSENTMFLGHAQMQGHGTAPSRVTDFAVWLMQEGLDDPATSGSATHSNSTSFPSGYNGVPEVYLTPVGAGAEDFIFAISEITRGGFTSVWSYIGSGSTSDFAVNWRSVGTISI